MTDEFKPGERDGFMREIDIKSFNDFLKERGLSPEDKEVGLVRDTWNAAVEAASQYFGNHEGTDYGAKDALSVPAPKIES